MNIDPSVVIFQLLGLLIPLLTIVGIILLIVFLVKTRNEQKRTAQKLDRIIELIENEQK